MRRLGELVRNLLGLDDGTQTDLARLENPQHRIRWRVAIGAALTLGTAVVVVAIVVSSISALMAGGSSISSDVILPGSSGTPGTSLTSSPGIAGGGDAIMVHVVGAVLVPGLYSVTSHSRVVDAVMAAGGLSAVADPCALNLAQPISDGQKIVVPATKDGSPGDPSQCAAADGSPLNKGTGDGNDSAAGPLISLATATVAELDTLPGIGPALAQRIVDWREATGGFTSVDQLGDVSGIGDKVLENIRDRVTL